MLRNTCSAVLHLSPSAMLSSFILLSQLGIILLSQHFLLIPMENSWTKNNDFLLDVPQCQYCITWYIGFRHGTGRWVQTILFARWYTCIYTLSYYLSARDYENDRRSSPEILLVVYTYTKVADIEKFLGLWNLQIIFQLFLIILYNTDIFLTVHIHS